MKRIEELSHEELIVLTDEEINTFIDIEIAEAGIKPYPLPKEPSLENIGIIASEKFYKLGELLFKDKEEAIRTASMDIYKTIYDWNISYDYKWAEKNLDSKIEEISLYKKEDILRSCGLIKARDSKKSQYQKDKENYDKYLRSTAQWRDYAWKIISEAREKEYSIQNAISAFNKYMEISEKDEIVALRFFDMAFKDEPTDIKEIALKRLNIHKVEEVPNVL